MTGRRLSLLAVCCLSALAASGAIANGQQSLSTEQEQRVQIQQLKEQLLQAQVVFAQCRAEKGDLQARFDSATLSSAQAELKATHDALEAEIRKTLGAAEEDVVDWSTTPPTLKKPPK